MKGKGKFLLTLMVIALALAILAPVAAAGGGVEWFRWDACQTVFEWQVSDDILVDGWTVAYFLDGTPFWTSPFVPATGATTYSTAAPVAFEGLGATLCETYDGATTCKLESGNPDRN